MGFFQRFTRPRAKLWLAVEKNELSLGDELKGIVRVQAQEEFDVEKINVWLGCFESVKKTRRYQTRRKRYAGDLEGEKVWQEEEYWDKQQLHAEAVQVSGSIHVSVGSNNEFPFVFKIPSIGRETYHSVDKYVRWLVGANMKVRGRKSIDSQSSEILVAKPSMLLKEIVREVVLIPCAYCGGLMPQTSTFCPNCGARRKG